MRTNCSFTQLDKHQLSSPGAHPSPTSLVLYHSKILRLDQVTVCSTLRLPLPCRAGHSDSQLSASCVTAAFTSKAAMGENEPAHCCIHLQGCRGGERAGSLLHPPARLPWRRTSRLTAAFTCKAAVAENEPARETFCGVLCPDLEEHYRTSARLPVPGPSPHSLGYQFQEGLGRCCPVHLGRGNGIGNHAGSLRWRC